MHVMRCRSGLSLLLILYLRASENEGRTHLTGYRLFLYLLSVICHFEAPFAKAMRLCAMVCASQLFRHREAIWYPVGAAYPWGSTWGRASERVP